MSEAWDRVHRRHRLVQTVLRDAGRGRTGARAVERHRARIEREYGDLGPFLADLQRRWNTRLAARLDVLLEDQTALQGPKVVRVWEDVRRDEPGLAAILDAYASHPALAEGRRTYDRLLRRATGLSTEELRQTSARRRARSSWYDACPVRRWYASWLTG